jgi:hypothetical protein
MTKDHIRITLIAAVVLLWLGLVVANFAAMGAKAPARPVGNSLKVHLSVPNAKQYNTLVANGWNCSWRVAANGADCYKTFKA